MLLFPRLGIASVNLLVGCIIALLSASSTVATQHVVAHSEFAPSSSSNIDLRQYSPDDLTHSERRICKLLYAGVDRDVLEYLGWLEPDRLLLALRSPRELQFVEFFGGCGEVTAAFYRIGFQRGRCLDLVFDDNILTVDGYARFLLVALRLQECGFGWLSPPCSNFVWMSRGVHLRSRSCPWGARYREDVREANIIVVRCLLVIKLLTLRLVFWITEQPLSSCMYRLPPFWSFLLSCPAIRGVRCMRKFLWLGFWGGPVPKPTELWGVCPCLEMLVSKRPKLLPRGNKHAWKTTTQKTIRRGNKNAVVFRVYGVRKNMKNTQEYPRAFAQRLAELVMKQHCLIESIRQRR